MAIIKILGVLGLVGSVVYAMDTAADKKGHEVKEKALATAQAAAEYTKEQKAEMQKSLEDKMGKISGEIADLKKDAAAASGKVKKELDQEIKTLEKKQKSLQKDLARWKKSTGKAWEDMKNGMSQAMDNISESYQKAKKEFSETKSE
ncbi:MAG TPA: hypothetical protein VIG33_11465 [Pseudobdellovibrionaceae bacterium]|jgi:flagellar motility protein MotE (MotC chaperone)